MSLASSLRRRRIRPFLILALITLSLHSCLILITPMSSACFDQPPKVIGKSSLVPNASYISLPVAANRVCMTYLTPEKMARSIASSSLVDSASDKVKLLQCSVDFLAEYERQCSERTIVAPPAVIPTTVVENGVWKFFPAFSARLKTVEHQQLCPCIPRNLCGFVDVIDELTDTSFADDGGNGSMPETDSDPDAGGITEPGGRWRPNWCQARQRIAVIVPLRNREKHLYVFLRHMTSMLRRQLLDFTIFVVEQIGNDVFNRGSLINIGFIEASNRGKFDCYFLHDVDQLPLDDRDFYTCSTSPRHVAVYQKHRNYKPMYDCYFGAVQSFTGEQFQKINGYSNMFRGWGGEDDDLLHRVWAQNITVERRPLCISRFGMLNHVRDVGNPVNIQRGLSAYFRPEYYQIDGLNSLKYQIASTEERRWYIRLRARIPAPDTKSYVSIKFRALSKLNPKIDRVRCQMSWTRKDW